MIFLQLGLATIFQEKKIARLIISSLLWILLSTGLSHAQSDDKDDKEKLTTYQLLDLFGEVFQHARSQYVDEVTDDKLIEAAISGMLQSLDPHSSYLNKRNFKDISSSNKGKFGGLGIEVTLDKSGYIKVVSPIDGTPAAKAGILANDLIVAIDGKTVQGGTLNEAVDKMRGKVGSSIVISIMRGDEEIFDVELIRAIIVVQSVSSRLEGDIGYLRISSFTAQTQPGLEQAIKKLKKEGAEENIEIKGYILDLRNNPGGLLDQAISVSDSFLIQGEIVSTRGRNSDDVRRFHAKGADLIEEKPLVVLINGGSASASEIVAGALRDHNRAILLGTQSFGKGSVQTILPLSIDDTALKITTQRYYTPSGQSIQALGIQPHIKVEQSKVEPLYASSKRTREADLRGSLVNEDGKSKEDSTDENNKDEPVTEFFDYQLMRALDLLKGISIYQ